MSIGRRFSGLGRFASLFVAMVLSIAACTGESEGDDDEGDDDGGGSVASQCAIACERTAECQGKEPCEEGCVSGAEQAASLGCATYYRRSLDCVAVAGCRFDDCWEESETLLDCVTGGTPAGCAPTGTGPVSGDCVALCLEANSCPGAATVDCAASCSESAVAVAEYGCTEEYNRYNGCMSTCTDLCAQTGSECSIEFDAFSFCLAGA